ncbi:MAG: hypothetical protein L3K13_06615 [Thermoplasmata archaeon]|nr:hypothetical protein [Thermoplasmata archaeon]
MSAGEGFFTGRYGRRHLLMVAGAIVIAGVVIGSASFFYNHSSSANVTVSSAVAYLEQGKDAQGFYWFGVGQVNFTSGFPLSVGVGGSFTLSLNLGNDDSISHRVVEFTTNTPFKVLSSSPVTPVVYGGFEDGTIVVTVQAPSSSGSYALNVTAVCQ